MDWNRAETLLTADLERIASRATSPGAALAAMEEKVIAEITEVEAFLSRAEDRIAALPGLVEAEHGMAVRCDAVIAKAEADGREDLKSAAEARKGRHESQAAVLEAELDQLEGDLPRAADLLKRLEARREEIAGQGLVQGEREASPRAEEPAAAPESAAEEEALDEEFAALLAAMDEAPSPAPAPAPEAVASDDILADLPDLADVPEGELPEGDEDLDLDGMDFSHLDAMFGGGDGGGGGGAKAAVPATKTPSKAPAPAARAATTPARADSDGGATEKKGKGRLWLVVGAIVVVGGGTVAALFALQVF